MRTIAASLILMLLNTCPAPAQTPNKQKLKAPARKALDSGLKWLAHNQGAAGSWESNQLGLVSLGALAFMADGHEPGKGKYGKAAERALRYVIKNAKDSGILNMDRRERDIYNHGLATMALGQAMALGWKDAREPLAKAVRISLECQCKDGGWDYFPTRKKQLRGHDLSLLSVQIGGLKSAQQAGIKLPDNFDETVLRCLRSYYCAKDGRKYEDEKELKKQPGQFCYSGRRGSVAMAAAGVVSLQKLAQHDDWRAARSLEQIQKLLDELRESESDKMVCDAYTLYYVSQAICLSHDPAVRRGCAILQDHLISSQDNDSEDLDKRGSWSQKQWNIDGKQGQLFATSVSCFTLAISQRKLPMWRK